MTPQELHLVWESRRPRDPERDYAGRLSERDCAALYAAFEDN